jgi:hypothetical protein
VVGQLKGFKMKEKGKIKVIKKGSKPIGVPKRKDEVRTKRVAAREMVSTVSNWVSDFQSKKSEGAKLSFDKLFRQGPQPTES